MKVECEYRLNSSYWYDRVYGCMVKNFEGSHIDAEECNFVGKHRDDKTNLDVQLVQFQSQKLDEFPKNLHKAFPNLKYIVIINCDLKKVQREDFVGLENVESINLGCNELTSLPDDLFADMKNLRRFSFKKNRLERLSSKFLKPILHQLQFANFSDNKRIRVYFNSYFKDDPIKLEEDIDRLCLPPLVEPETALKLEAPDMSLSPRKRAFVELAKFRAAGEFTDSTIKIRGREYKIHRNILSAQSPVFRELFTGGSQKALKILEKAKDFSIETFDSFIDYFYLGDIDDGVNKSEMLELATLFEVRDLQKKCLKDATEDETVTPEESFNGNKSPDSVYDNDFIAMFMCPIESLHHFITAAVIGFKWLIEES